MTSHGQRSALTPPPGFQDNSDAEEEAEAAQSSDDEKMEEESTEIDDVTTKLRRKSQKKRTIKKSDLFDAELSEEEVKEEKKTEPEVEKEPTDDDEDELPLVKLSTSLKDRDVVVGQKKRVKVKAKKTIDASDESSLSPVKKVGLSPPLLSSSRTPIYDLKKYLCMCMIHLHVWIVFVEQRTSNSWKPQRRPHATCHPFQAFRPLRRHSCPLFLRGVRGHRQWRV